MVRLFVFLLTLTLPPASSRVESKFLCFSLCICICDCIFCLAIAHRPSRHHRHRHRSSSSYHLHLHHFPHLQLCCVFGSGSASSFLSLHLPSPFQPALPPSRRDLSLPAIIATAVQRQRLRHRRRVRKGRNVSRAPGLGSSAPSPIAPRHRHKHPVRSMLGDLVSLRPLGPSLAPRLS
ncbi:hypothetical protein V8C35DRAFT_120382 [Trichoderma chlorosporum]